MLATYHKLDILFNIYSNFNLFKFLFKYIFLKYIIYTINIIIILIITTINNTYASKI
jgi:hypothetical protein